MSSACQHITQHFLRFYLLFLVTKQSVDLENNTDFINTIGQDRRLGRPEIQSKRPLAVDDEDEETQIVQMLKYFAKLSSVGFLFLAVFLTCLFSKLLLIQIVSNQKYKDRMPAKDKNGNYRMWADNWLNFHVNDNLLIIGEILPFLYCSYIVKFKKDASPFCKDLFIKMLIPEALDVFGTHMFVWLVIPNCKQVTTLCIMSCVYSIPAVRLGHSDQTKRPSDQNLI